LYYPLLLLNSSEHNPETMMTVALPRFNNEKEGTANALEDDDDNYGPQK
jgi:hypothetical protein